MNPFRAIFGLFSIFRLGILWLVLAVSFQTWSASDPNRSYIKFKYGEPEAKEIFVDFLKNGKVSIHVMVNKEWLLLYSGTVYRLDIPKPGVITQQGEIPATTKVTFVEVRKDYFEFGATDKHSIYRNDSVIDVVLKEGERAGYWFNNKKHADQFYSLVNITNASKSTSRVQIVNHATGDVYLSPVGFSINDSLITVGSVFKVKDGSFAFDAATKSFLVAPEIVPNPNPKENLVKAPKDLDVPDSAPPKEPTDAKETTGKNDSIDSKKFEIEKSQVKVSSAENSGVEVLAWDVVKGFVDILNKPEKSPDSLDPLDSDMRVNIDSIYDNLIQKSLGSVKLLGSPGVGKSSLIEYMVSEVSAKQGPAQLDDYIFLEVNREALKAGSKWVSVLESKINAMLALSRKHKIVWVFDEFHSIRGDGTHSEKDTDITESFKKLMQTGELKIIGISTEDEWNKAFLSNPAFNERFGPVTVVEPVGKQLISKLKNYLKVKEYPILSEKILERIVDLSDKYDSEGAQPRKSVKLIERIFSTQNRIGSRDRTTEFQYRVPTKQEIEEAAISVFSLPSDIFDVEKFRERLLNLDRNLAKLIYGQDSAIQAVADSIRQAYSGMAASGKPRGRILLAGDKGLGKTELISSLEATMGLKVVRVVMTEFGTIAKLEELKRFIGEAVMKNSHAVLFFDEIEKASVDVQVALLQIMDKGKMHFTIPNSDGRSKSIHIDFKNTFTFFATNAGKNFILKKEKPLGFIKVSETEFDSQLKAEMVKDNLSEYLISRMSGITTFKYLGKDDYTKLVRKEVVSIIKTFQKSHPENKIRIHDLDKFISFFVNDTFRSTMDNRDVEKWLSASLRRQITNAFLGSRSGDVYLTYKNGQFESALCRRFYSN